ncbi:MAG TPA: acetyl-CoA carboxylase biotin carboxylase subunit [Ktedonobacteraceae bacterium]|nr:acetyl-CoA carboxylase biotin carboxylase subunit [Ktedonobacteraceae bacterium]
MFKKILIANRGEIAVRIMATCREMDIRTVAVYSAADRNAMHVRVADEAYYIGPAPAAQSYLRVDTILEIATRSRAEAIHPGYGFLSEKAAFVEACNAAGIVFIGPPADAMRLMGSKIAAKQLALSVDAPTIPGYNGESQDDEVLEQEATHIGFPLLIKASAGGGGKGMREVHQPSDFLEQLAGARREALASFGDGTVFLERLIQQPRHVEIQILGDTFGNLIHLGERECSIQRRHQKIVEESPSVALTPTLRAEMGAAAVRIAKAAGYVNAGTMEFILDDDKHFYFLEMNTRLQVEHPVTEFVTGLDLVRHQLLIAAGEPLQLEQAQIGPRGHAIETRLYAEDPDQNFLPSTGIVARFIEPHGPGIRVDGGIESGDEITQYYDPMIAKIIVYAENRPAAIERMRDALEQCAVFGVRTNAPLLHTIVTHAAFKKGNTHTSFLDEYSLIGNAAPQVVLPDMVLVVAALYDVLSNKEVEVAANHISTIETNPWKTLGPWRMIGEARRVTYTYQDKTYTIAVSPTRDEEEHWQVQLDAHTPVQVQCTLDKRGLVLLRQGENQTRAYVQRSNGEMQVALRGYMYRLLRRQPPDVDIAAHGGSTASAQKALTAPMAGTIIKVQAHEGDMVAQRQVLVILSAMKMEHTIIAPYEGKVRRIYYQEGDVVKGGATIVEME